jgi:glycine C-acetyltransferase
MQAAFAEHLRDILADIDSKGLTKHERLIDGPQGGRIAARKNGATTSYINLCSNNYLGLAKHPEVVAAASTALDNFGFGMASVRFICGAQTLHRELERAIARYLRKDDAILFAACFDANGGLFETLLGPDDAIVSDSLNHASIIDGVRLSKAKRYRYANGDMTALEEELKRARADGARFIVIATDGVFSMDGYVANLRDICDLAGRCDAMVMVDDCHATGHLGPSGRGSPALTGTADKVDIITGTLGKTLGGGMGGFIAAAQPVVDLLRQRARPYLFSNSLAPPIAAGSLKAIEIAEADDEGRTRLAVITRRFREGLAKEGFDLLPGETPIVPVMLYEAKTAQQMAAELDARGVFVAGFFYPVVPEGKARIRTQLSTALSDGDIDFAIDAFAAAGKAVGVI